jgi:hypothetical protein
MMTMNKELERMCKEAVVAYLSHSQHFPRAVMRNRCSAEAIQVCHEIFTSHYNYNHNETNNCLSCFLLCISFHFLYYSRTDKIY